MRRPDPWPVLGREKLQDCKVFHVSRMTARSPRSGNAHDFYRIDADDWVNVVPETPDGRLVLIRQWRHGAQSVTLEIPGGIVDPGEGPGEAAARELEEETGYRAARVDPIGAVNPNPALFGNCVHTFVARDCVRVGEIRNSGTEETAVELVDRDQLPDLLRRGAIDHALVIAAFQWYALAGG